MVVALDIGSSSTRSAVFDERGRILPRTAARREYSLEYGGDGAAELSPASLYQDVKTCLGQTLERAGKSRPILAVGASAFWHGLLGLDRTGRPLTPIFTWADSRCAADATELRCEFDERKIHAQTGCMLRASFWPAKLRWLRRTDRALFRRVHRWVSPADWICAKLFGGIGTSESMASATGLYDLRIRNWHEQLCDACGLDARKLGELRDSSGKSGPAFSRLTGAQIFNAIGDGAAGNVGSAATGPGQVAINVGTSAAVRTVMRGSESVPFGLFQFVLDRDRFVVGGAISNAGNLHRWCLRELRVAEPETRALGREPAANDGLAVLPFWVNERAPTWPENFPGAIVGLTQLTSASEILRATTCASFYRLAEILELLEKKTGRAKQVIVSGGILRSIESLNLLADCLGRDVLISPQREASLGGAAVYVLEKLGCEIVPLPKAKTIPHDRALARKHRTRRKRQAALEKLLSSEGRAAARP